MFGQEGRFYTSHPTPLVVVGSKSKWHGENVHNLRLEGRDRFGVNELGFLGAEKSSDDYIHICSYRKPTQVGESSRLRRSRELSLRN